MLHMSSYRPHILFFLLCYLLFPHFVSAQSVFSLTEEDQFTIDSTYYSFLVDSTQKLQHSDVLDLDDTQFRELKNIAQFDKHHSYWLKLSIQNTTEKYDTWRFNLGEIADADVYVKHQSGTIEKLIIGLWVEGSKKQIHDGNTEAIAIDFTPKELKTIWIHIKPNKKQGSKLFFNIIRNGVHNKLSGKNLLANGLLQGFLWMTIIYNLFLYFTTRDRAFMFYVLYVALMSVSALHTFGIMRTYWFPDYTDIYYITAAGPWTAFIFYFALMREFASSSPKLKKTNLWIKYFIIYAIICTVVLLIISLIDINLEQLFSLYFVMTLIIAFISFFFLLLVKGDFSARIFAIGSAFLILGTITAVLIQQFKPGMGVFNSFNAGLVGEVTIFSLGLSLRLKRSEQEKIKAQDGLIVQLQENERIKDEANRQLERKVEERTEQLQDSNNKLSNTLVLVQDQNKEIETHNR